MGQGLGGKEGPSDLVEAAQADALVKAANEGAWEVVAGLTAQLKAWREAWANVEALSKERSKRGGG